MLEDRRLTMRDWQIRFALIAEFLLALAVVFIVWSLVVAPDQLDLVPWYWKLPLGCGLALAITQATAAALREEDAWNPRTMGWVATSVALLVIIIAVCHHYQSLEPVEDEEGAVTESTRA